MTVQDKPYRGDNRALMWLGHNSIRITFAYSAFAVAIAVAAFAGWQPVYLTWPGAAFTLVWVGSIMAEMGYHDERLCEKCGKATPLDPQGAIDRWRPVLRAYHDSRFLIAVALIVVTGTTVMVMSPQHHAPWWAYAVAIFVAVVVAGYFWFVHIHRRLYPWCPWCRWEGGGDEEISPDLPVGSREL